jgi:hypothetical protein
VSSSTVTGFFQMVVAVMSDAGVIEKDFIPRHAGLTCRKPVRAGAC